MNSYWVLPNARVSDLESLGWEEGNIRIPWRSMAVVEVAALEESFVDMVGTLANQAGLFGKDSKRAEWWSRVIKPISKKAGNDAGFDSDMTRAMTSSVKDQWRLKDAPLDKDSVAKIIEDTIEYFKLAIKADYLSPEAMHAKYVRGKEGYSIRDLRKMIGDRRSSEEVARKKKYRPRNPSASQIANAAMTGRWGRESEE